MRLQAKLPALCQTLEGQVEETRCMLLCHLLNQIHGLKLQIEQWQSEVDRKLSPNESGPSNDGIAHLRDDHSQVFCVHSISWPDNQPVNTRIGVSLGTLQCDGSWWWRDAD